MNPPGTSAILRVRELSFAYAGEPPLAAAWSAAIGPGLALLHGDTGSGKSTLLRVLAGVLPASAGGLALGGATLAGEPEAYRREVFFGDPATDTFDALTARACTAALGVDDARFDADEWQRLVDGFVLAPHLDKPMFMLSTGSKRKVWLAAALASGRALVLLDEPAGALDAASVGCLWRALERCAQRPDRAVVVASAERIDRVPLAGVIELPLR